MANAPHIRTQCPQCKRSMSANEMPRYSFVRTPGMIEWHVRCKECHNASIDERKGVQEAFKCHTHSSGRVNGDNSL